jgi:hypothetical protein
MDNKGQSQSKEGSLDHNKQEIDAKIPNSRLRSASPYYPQNPPQNNSNFSPGFG